MRFFQMEKVSETKGLFAVFIAVGVGDSPSGRAKCGTGFGEPVLFKFILNTMPRHGNGSAG